MSWRELSTGQRFWPLAALAIALCLAQDMVTQLGPASSSLEGGGVGWPACTLQLPVIVLILLALCRAIPRSPLTGPSEAPLGAFPEGAPGEGCKQATFLVDQDIKVTAMSRGAESFGFVPAQLLGRPFSEVVREFHPLATDTESTVSCPDGTTTRVQMLTGPAQPGTTGKVVSLRQAGQDTKLSGKFAACLRLAEMLEQAVVLVSERGNVLTGNPAFRQAAGAVEPNAWLLAMVTPESRLGVADSLEAALRQVDRVEADFAFQGRPTTFFRGSFAAVTEDGQVALLGVFEPRRTERSDTVPSFPEAAERTKHSQKIEALGRLAGGVAHDFNNLLMTMIHNLEPAVALLADHHPARPHLEEVLLATQKASGVTRQLLHYSRKKPSEATAVSVHRAVTDTLKLSKSLTGRTRVETHLQATRDQVWIEDGQLDQILMNLLVNAKDALGSQGCIEIRSSNEQRSADPSIEGKTAEYLLLEVIDDGPGIPPEIQETVFEPYFTTKEVGKGTGLGLSTVASIVEKAGGTVSLSSQPGRTAFSLRLPLSETPVAEPVPTPAAVGASSKPTASPLTGKVLLVEDESGIRRVVKTLLERRGLEVVVAVDGTQACHLLKGNDDFDLLITDLIMPGLSGSALAKIYTERRANAPVLYISGYPGDTLTGVSLGSTCLFLAKPFSSDELHAKVQSLLSGPSAPD